MRFVTLVVLLFIACMILVVSVTAQEAAEKNLILLYQGDFKGYVEGCG